MWLDLIVLALALALFPLIAFRTDKNGILFCKISLVIVFLIIACEIAAIIIKSHTGENTVFNIIVLLVQVMNLTSFSMSWYAYKQKAKKDNTKTIDLKNIVV